MQFIDLKRISDDALRAWLFALIVAALFFVTICSATMPAAPAGAKIRHQVLVDCDYIPTMETQ